MKSRKGFTLIELMIAMAIIAILATAGISAYTGYLKKGRDTARVGIANQVNTAVNALMASNNGIPPTSVELIEELGRMNMTTAMNVIQPQSLYLSTLSDTLGNFMGIPSLFAAAIREPSRGKTICIGYDTNGAIVRGQSCAFRYIVYGDNTYVIGYGVEHESSLQKNFYHIAAPTSEPGGASYTAGNVFLQVVGTAGYVGTPSVGETGGPAPAVAIATPYTSSQVVISETNGTVAVINDTILSTIVSTSSAQLSTETTGGGGDTPTLCGGTTECTSAQECVNDVCQDLCGGAGGVICTGGQVCESGDCIDLCGGVVCTAGQVCDTNNACVTAAGVLQTGDACTTGSECASEICFDYRWGGNVCRPDLNFMPCSSNEDCGGLTCDTWGYVCSNGAFDAPCSAHTDCTTGYCGYNASLGYSGYTCSLGENGFGCYDNEGCQSGICDIYNTYTCLGGGLANGESCSMAEQCTSNYCDGTCTTLCGGSPCTGGQVCGQYNTCVDPCGGVACNFDQQCINDVCTDTCGGYGEICGVNEQCVSGLCMNLCGGVVCQTGQTCVNNACQIDSAGACAGKSIGQACEGTTAIYAGTYNGFSYMTTSSDGGTSTSWSSENISTGAISQTNGASNTATLAGITSGSYPAADYCDSLVSGGFSDWFLPSRFENAYVLGTNRVALGMTTPSASYWTSTEDSINSALSQVLGSSFTASSKSTNRRFRCVRKY